MCKTATLKTLVTTTLLLAFLAGTTQVFALIQETKFTAYDAAGSDRFGYAVSTDGHYAIAGAYTDDHAHSDAGSAYVFERVGENWNTSGTKLTASDAYASDEFGCSVSIDGSYAIVGAHRDDDAGASSGSAYVFKYSPATGWIQQPKLTAGDATTEDYFGSAVSIRGDYAIVGAYGCDPGSTYNAGAAYIFNRSETTGWTQQAKLTADTPSISGQFGNAVSIDGNYAIVGEENDEDYTGAVYVFERSGGTWSSASPTKLVAADAATGSFFGHSVSIDGDYAIVGAYWDSHDGLDYKGSAYIFHRSEGTWIQQAKLIADDAAVNDWFGCSVSISGEYAIVGSHQDDDDGSQSGSAYVFRRTSETTWTQIYKLTANDAEEKDNFGLAVSLRGEYGMVGSPYSDDNGSSSGSAYVFQPVPEPCTAAMLLLAAVSLLVVGRRR